MVVEHDGHAGQIGSRATERVCQIDFGIGRVETDGLLSAGEDHRLGAALNEIAEGRGGIGHGIRAVGDDEAIIAPIIFPDAAHHLQPVLRPHIGAVQIQQLHTVHIADAGNGRQVAQQLLCGQLRGKAVLCNVGGNGAAGSDE